MSRIKGSFYCDVCELITQLPLEATHCRCGQKLQYCPELDEQRDDPSFQAQNEADQRRAAELVRYHENLERLGNRLRQELDGVPVEEEE